MLRSIGYLFLMVPLGAFLVTDPQGIAEGLSRLLGGKLAAVTWVGLLRVHLDLPENRPDHSPQREAVVLA